MEKTIIIDGREVRLKSSGAFLLRYRAQFGKDPLKEILKMESAIDHTSQKFVDIEKLDFEVFYNFVWVLAKTADPSIEPLLEWLDSFESFPISEVFIEIQDMIFESFVTSKKNNPQAPQKRTTRRK